MPYPVNHVQDHRNVPEPHYEPSCITIIHHHFPYFSRKLWIAQMDKRTEIKFYAKLGKSASETYQLMKQVYNDCCLSRSNVFVRHKPFLDGSDAVEDDQRSGEDQIHPEHLKLLRKYKVL
ncbi:hypothetical protein TNCV_1735831 [Trichonephila clavipes]|nr:hypothetical protein TNCV_1735831 [Trichonephila clavipes]